MIAPLTKVCRKCKLEKNFNDLIPIKYPSGNLGVKSICKSCRNIEAVRSQEKPEAKLQKRLYQIGYKYNLSAEDYTAMLEKQGGSCAICLTLPTTKALGVDHDHKTGAIRALLCSSCNGALGLAKDNQAILLEMIDYLKLHQGSR